MATERVRKVLGMYEKYFSLNCRPFDLAPDPRFLYLTGQHSRAAANIRFALMNHDSFVVITGEIGTGKTTVLNSALDQLGPNYVTARLIHTTRSDIELLQALLSEFGIANYGTKKVKLLDELRNYFLEQHLAGRHVVIIVDEAQHLSPAALEEFRLLSCIDTHDRRIVSIVLTGQPSLNDVLDHASLAQLRQRTRLRQRFRPLEEADTVEYIRHRLQVAGGKADELFEAEVPQEIHRLTLGVPRLINTLCDTALTACMVESRRSVDMATLGQVVQELGWRWSDGGGRARSGVRQVSTRCNRELRARIPAGLLFGIHDRSSRNEEPSVQHRTRAWQRPGDYGEGDQPSSRDHRSRGWLLLDCNS